MSEILVGKEIEGKTYYTSEFVEMLSNQIKEKEQEIERLNKRIKELEEGFKATTEDLCEESTKIEKAIEYVEESYNETVEGIEGIAKFFSKRNETLLKILKGEIK